MDSPLLTEIFSRLPENGSGEVTCRTWKLYSQGSYLVQLSEKEIACQARGQPEDCYSIDLSQVIGCTCVEDTSVVKRRALLTIFAYPKDESGIRRRAVYTFFYDKHDTYEGNYAVTSRWKCLIDYLISSSERDSAALQDFIEGTVQSLPGHRRRWLILLNPFSGKKDSEEIFSSTISSMLTEAEVDYTLLKTEYKGHAQDLVNKAQLENFTGIVTASGDGLLHEVLNGLLTRPDWSEAIRKPIGVLPTGSGNGFSSMLCAIARERMDKRLAHVVHAAYLMLRPTIRELAIPKPPRFDLVAVDTADGRLYSFLATAWGLIADIDIESEKYRFLGGVRFTVGALVRIANLRVCRGRVSFLPVDVAEAKETLEARRQRFQSLLHHHKHHDARNSVMSDDGQFHTFSEENAIDFPNVGRYRSSLVENSDARPQSNRFSLLSDCQILPEAQEDSTPSRIETPLLPPKLSDSVPLNWVTIEDSFVTVVASTCSHLSFDLAICPKYRPGDGEIRLLLTRSPVTRKTLLRQMLATSKGDIDIASDPSYGVESYRVYAFRIEPVPPSPPTRIMTVDGERITYGTVQAQVLPGIASLL